MMATAKIVHVSKSGAKWPLQHVLVPHRWNGPKQKGLHSQHCIIHAHCAHSYSLLHMLSRLLLQQSTNQAHLAVIGLHVQ